MQCVWPNTVSPDLSYYVFVLSVKDIERIGIIIWNYAKKIN